MKNEEQLLTVSEVRSLFHHFFELIKTIYNSYYFKSEKATKVEDIKKYSDELFKNNDIDEEFYNLIEESLQKFSLLLVGEIKKIEPSKVQERLSNLKTWISLAIDDANYIIETTIIEKI